MWTCSTLKLRHKQISTTCFVQVTYKEARNNYAYCQSDQMKYRTILYSNAKIKADFRSKDLTFPKDCLLFLCYLHFILDFMQNHHEVNIIILKLQEYVSFMISFFMIDRKNIFNFHNLYNLLKYIQILHFSKIEWSVIISLFLNCFSWGYKVSSNGKIWRWYVWQHRNNNVGITRLLVWTAFNFILHFKCIL